jgi:BirA family transcriptional regulator, biotin operon repressor / biotin---[acetyl-CoA-carboxylase] ligase
VNLDNLRQALTRPPQQLGVVPEFSTLRPKFQLYWVEQTDSTNRALAAMMATGAAAGTVLIAATQRSGRGQWGRQWLSQPGGLYLSLGLKPDLAAHRSVFLTLSSTWGITTSLRNLGVPAQVKWPNDLVVKGKKLGGVLVETRLVKSYLQDAVVGLGLNCFNPTPATGISLRQLIQPDQPAYPLNTLEDIAAVALCGLLQGYFFWQSQGDSAFLAAYQAQMAHIGQTVVLNDNQARVIGIAPSGNLQVQILNSRSSEPTQREVKPGEVTLGYNA